MLSFLLMLRDIFLLFKVLFCLLMMSYITHSMLGGSRGGYLVRTQKARTQDSASVHVLIITKVVRAEAM